MIVLDATPLVLGPRRGVARALAHLLEGVARAAPPVPVSVVAPGPLPPDVAWNGRVDVFPARTARAFRRLLPRSLGAQRPLTYVSPWSAFPRGLPRTGIRVAAVVHELPWVRSGPVEGRLRAWRHRTWLRRDVEACDAILVPSQATRDDLLALHPEAAPRVHVVPWGFDPTRWERDGAAAPDGPALVVGTGGSRRGARKKGLDVVAAAASAFSGEVLVVGDDAGLSRLPGRLRWKGPLDDAGLATTLGHVSMLVYMSRSEGFGFPPLEAMAAGVPVVAARGGAIPEVCGDAAEYVPAGDARALAAAMERLRTDLKRRADLVAAGRDRARSFPVKEAATSFLDAVLASRPAPRDRGPPGGRRERPRP